MAATISSAATRNAPGLVNPAILPEGGGGVMPGKSDEFALTSLTALGYLGPAFFVLLLGLDWPIFIICIGYELVLFVWARVAQMWAMPGGILALVATLFMLQPLGITTVLVLIAVTYLLTGIPVDVNGVPYQISGLSRLLGGAAIVALTIDAVRRFRGVTLPRIRFMKYINARYMFADNPDRPLFPGWLTIIQNIVLSFFAGSLAGAYFGASMAIALVSGYLLGFVVSEERAFATGAALGFGATRLLMELARQRLQKASGMHDHTERGILERLAKAHDAPIVLRDDRVRLPAVPPPLPGTTR